MLLCQDIMFSIISQLRSNDAYCENFKIRKILLEKILSLGSIIQMEQLEHGIRNEKYYEVKYDNKLYKITLDNPDFSKVDDKDEILIEATIEQGINSCIYRGKISMNSMKAFARNLGVSLPASP